MLEGLPMPDFEPGWVWLAGAGPGDPALLTLASVHALRSADAIIYDALVGKDILSLAGEDTLLEYAGKRGGKPSAKQVDITLRIIELARQGKRVLRLKGGDPFVFGRGGEEALALVDAGIPFRIIPGISAGIGGLAYAGIPVTHRDTNSLVTFLTGHDATGLTPSAIDWIAVAKSSPVIVMYMALKHLSEIRDRLMEGGRKADEPLAIISQATLSDQRVLETTLGEAPKALEDSGIQPPAMVVLGEVVRLRAALDWVGALSGRRPQADPLGMRQTSDAG